MKINQLTVRRFSSKRSSVIWFIGGLSVLIGFPLFLLLLSPKNDYALYDAIDRNDTKAVKKLLEKGVDVNQCLLERISFSEKLNLALNQQKQPMLPPPLGYALSLTNLPQKGSLSFKMKSPSNAYDSRIENIEIVRSLLDHDAKIDEIIEGAPTGFTKPEPIFQLAVKQNKLKTVRLLLDRGVKLSDPAYRKTLLLMSAFNTLGNEDQSMFKLILNAGADINEKDEQGRSILTIMQAQYRMNKKALQSYLLDNGRRKSGLNWIKKYENTIQLLKDHGAK